MSRPMYERATQKTQKEKDMGHLAMGISKRNKTRAKKGKKKAFLRKERISATVMQICI